MDSEVPRYPFMLFPPHTNHNSRKFELINERFPTINNLTILGSIQHCGIICHSSVAGLLGTLTPHLI